MVILIHLFSALLLAFGCAAKGELKTSDPQGKSGPRFTEVAKSLTMKPRKLEAGVLCSNEKAQRVRVTYGRMTTLTFPVTPKEVLPGALVFDFKKIGNDLNILALSRNSKTNMVVYMYERKCSFDLVTVQGHGDDILSVHDPEERQFEVNFE